MEKIKIEPKEFDSEAETFDKEHYGIADETSLSLKESCIKTEPQVMMEQIKIEPEEYGLEAKNEIADENMALSFIEPYVKIESKVEDTKISLDKLLQDDKNNSQVGQINTEKDSNLQVVQRLPQTSKDNLEEQNNDKFACDPEDNSLKKPFVCNACGNSFTQKATLNRHMSKHTGLKPFLCDLCNKSFSQKSDLSRHILIHSGEKPYSCNVCGRSCYQKYDLVAHMRIHTGQRPFRCNVCSKSFGRKFHLNTHMITHRSPKP